MKQKNSSLLLKPWSKLLVLVLILSLASPGFAAAARKKRWYDQNNPFHKNSPFKDTSFSAINSWNKNNLEGAKNLFKVGAYLKPNNLGLNKYTAPKFTQITVIRPQQIQPVKLAFTQLPKLNSNFTKFSALNAVQPIKPAFVQLPKIGSNFAKLPTLNAIQPIKPAFTQLPKMSSAFTQLPKLNASFVKLPSLATIKPIKPAFTQLPKLNSAFTKLPTLKPAFTQLPKITPAFTQLPKLNSAFSFTKLPALKPAFTQLPKLNSAFTQLPKIKPAFMQLPKLNSAFTQLPKIKSAFTQMPKINFAFTQLPKLNAVFTLKSPKLVFTKIEPLEIPANIFSKNTFKFTPLPNLETPEFRPYNFTVAKITPLKIQPETAPAPQFTLVQLPPLIKAEPAKAFNSGQLLAQGSLAASLTPQQPIVKDRKVKQLALLSKEIPKAAAISPPAENYKEVKAEPALKPSLVDEEAAVVKTESVSHVKALTGYISSVSVNAQLQNLAKKALASQNIAVPAIAQTQALKVTPQYVHPAEKFLQGYVAMREK